MEINIRNMDYHPKSITDTLWMFMFMNNEQYVSFPEKKFFFFYSVILLASQIQILRHFNMPQKFKFDHHYELCEGHFRWLSLY